jgi:5-(carboxyamino)imidazole ribonucleotide mutase
MMKKVAIIMGSDSDLPVVSGAIKQLKAFGIPFEAHVISAHRTPYDAEQFAKNASDNGFGVIIAAAGKAAHLGGIIAAYTSLPVIGLPIRSSTMDGLDSLLSIVQMPSGVPVATVAIGGAQNAAILAAQILGVFDESIAEKLRSFKSEMAEKVRAKDMELQNEINSI